MGTSQVSIYGERIARVEVEVAELKKSFDEFKDDTKEQFMSVNTKLDVLLKSHDKGSGIISFLGWIAGPSLLLGVIEVLQVLGRAH